MCDRHYWLVKTIFQSHIAQDLRSLLTTFARGLFRGLDATERVLGRAMVPSARLGRCERCIGRGLVVGTLDTARLELMIQLIRSYQFSILLLGVYQVLYCTVLYCRQDEAW